MISEFIMHTERILKGWKQSIFYLSEAYTEVFYGHHKIKNHSRHKCIYRYMPDENFRLKFESEKALFLQENEELNEEIERYCTCTVVDLLYQADRFLTKHQ